MITLSELGPKVVLCGRAGNDSFGQIYIDRLSERKNLTSAIVRENGDTGSSIVLIPSVPKVGATEGRAFVPVIPIQPCSVAIEV